MVIITYGGDDDYDKLWGHRPFYFCILQPVNKYMLNKLIRITPNIVLILNRVLS